jgi:hypothetical protein
MIVMTSPRSRKLRGLLGVYLMALGLVMTTGCSIPPQLQALLAQLRSQASNPNSIQGAKKKTKDGAKNAFTFSQDRTVEIFEAAGAGHEEVVGGDPSLGSTFDHDGIRTEEWYFGHSNDPVFGSGQGGGFSNGQGLDGRVVLGGRKFEDDRI